MRLAALPPRIRVFELGAAQSKFHKSEAQGEKTAEEIIDLLGIRPLRRELPKNLPYGLQRRVEIGRALSLRPNSLLLDEPAAGMNSGGVEELIQLIAGFATNSN